jgi:hypothetical protein
MLSPRRKTEGPVKCGNPVDLVHRDMELLPDIFKGFFGKVFLLGLNILKNG